MINQNILENYTQIKIKECTYIRVNEVVDIVRDLKLKATKKFILDTVKNLAKKIVGFGLAKFITVEQLATVLNKLKSEKKELDTVEEIVDSVKKEDLNKKFKEVLKDRSDRNYKERVAHIINFSKKQYIEMLENLHIKRLKNRKLIDLKEIVTTLFCKFVIDVNRNNAFNKKIVKIIDSIKK